MGIHPVHLLVLAVFQANVAHAFDFFGFVEGFAADLVLPAVNTAVDELCDITLGSIQGIFNISDLVSCDCGVNAKGFESLLALELNGEANAECTPGDSDNGFCLDENKSICAKGKVGVAVNGTLGVFSGAVVNKATASATIDFNGIDLTIMGELSLEDITNPELTACTLGGTSGSPLDLCQCNAEDCEGLAAKIQCGLFGFGGETGCINPFFGLGG